MIQQIIAMLQIDEFYGKGQYIDIAKGKHKLHTSFRKAIKQAKREIISKRNGRS